MMKLVYLLHWKGDALSPIKDHHPDIQFVQTTSKEHAVSELPDADIFVVGGTFYDNEVAETVNSAAEKLRWIQSAAIGTDMFEKGGIPAGVMFSNAAGLKGKSVSEHAMALLLGYVHALPQMERGKSKPEWVREEIRPIVSCLEGMTMLVLGYGSIGREIARKAKAFDMHVVAVNTSGTGDGLADEIINVDALTNRLPDADFVVNALPLTEGTSHLIGADALAAMKPSAVIVNVGRGQVIDHAALTKALQDGTIAGACLDVFEEEPLPLDDPLWMMSNVILSPHVAGNGGQVAPRFAELVSQNLSRLRDGHSLINEMKLGGV